MQQAQKFVLDQLGDSCFLIYYDGTLFSNFLIQISNLLKLFKEEAPVVEEWSSQGWNEFYMKLKLCVYNYGQWVQPYHL